MIAAQGLEASAQATINHRQGKVRGEMYEMKAIMEDFRLQAVGGMAGAIDVWELGICKKLRVRFWHPYRSQNSTINSTIFEQFFVLFEISTINSTILVAIFRTLLK